jgi:hypothetical protein
MKKKTTIWKERLCKFTSFSPSSYGENVYPQAPGKYFVTFLFESLRQPLLIILTIVGFISAILGVTFPEQESHRWFA